MARKTTRPTAPPDPAPEPPAKSRTRPRPTTRSTPVPADAAPELDPRERAARALEAKAEAGDVAAIKAMADGVADRLRGRDRPRGDQLPPHVAAAMIRAVVGDDPAPPPPPVVGAKVECPLCRRWFDAQVEVGTGRVKDCRPQGQTG